MPILLRDKLLEAILSARLVFFSIPLLISSLPNLPAMEIYFSKASGFPYANHVVSFTIFCASSFLTGLIYLWPHTHRQRNLGLNAALWSLTFLIVVVLTTYHTNAFTRFLGAPSLAAIFCGTLFALALYILELGVWKFVVGLGLIVLALVFLPLQSKVRTLDPEDVEVSESYNADIAEGFRDWIRNRKDLQSYRDIEQPYPVFLVSAEGGGIYAALHTYSALDTYSRSCPNFRQHVFSISSVSGGSFGAAAFASEEGAPGAEPDIQPCRYMPSDNSLLFARDYLSPVLGAFLFGNVPNFFTGYSFDLLDSSEVLERNFIDELKFANLDNNAKSWSPYRNDPAVFFNTVNTVSGRVELVSPLLFDRGSRLALEPGDEFHPDMGTIRETLSYASAASISARFPFLTPSGLLIDEAWPEYDGFEGVRYSSYVDGGYVDNSGIRVSKQIEQELTNDVDHSIGSRACSVHDDRDCGFIFLKSTLKGWDAPNVDFSIYFEDQGRADAIYSAEARSLTNCLARSHDACVKEIWDAGYVPVKIVHLLIYENSWYETYSFQLEDGIVGSRKQSVFDPIITLLSARASRASVERHTLLHENYEIGNRHVYGTLARSVLQTSIAAENQSLPLSWSLGRRKTEELVSKYDVESSCWIEETQDGPEVLSPRCALSEISVILTNDGIVK